LKHKYIVKCNRASYKIVFFLYFLSLLCWEYIVTFIKILTKYQIHYSWIHPLHQSSLSPPPIPGIVSFFYLHTCIHSICTIFTLLYPFLLFSPLPLVPTPQTGPILPSCFFLSFLLSFCGTGAWTQGLLLKPLHQPYFVIFIEIGSHDLFAWAGFEQQSSWSLPPEYLGL
jgi:hypothetical protein